MITIDKRSPSKRIPAFSSQVIEFLSYRSLTAARISVGFCDSLEILDACFQSVVSHTDPFYTKTHDSNRAIRSCDAVVFMQICVPVATQAVAEAPLPLARERAQVQAKIAQHKIKKKPCGVLKRPNGIFKRPAGDGIKRTTFSKRRVGSLRRCR